MRSWRTCMLHWRNPPWTRNAYQHHLDTGVNQINTLEFLSFFDSHIWYLLG